MYSLPNEESNPSAGSNVSYGHPTKFIINLNGSEVETVTWNSTNNRWEGSTRYISLQVVASGKRWQIRQITNGAAQAFGNIFSGSGDSELSNSPVDSTYSNGYSVADDNSDYYDPEMFMFTGDTINITRPDSSHPLHIKDSNGNDVAIPYTPHSLEFNGTDNYVTMGSPSSLDITGDMTLSIWVNTDQNTQYTALFSKRNGSGRQFYFYLRNDSGNKNVSLQTQPPGGSISQMNTSGNPITLNTWHHVAAVIKSGVTNGTTIYVDGNAVGTGTMMLASNSTADFTIGSNQGTDNFFDGKLDEAAIFNTALSASDITSIYNSGTPGNISSLNPVGWWRMGDNDSGSGTTITDQGSGGNDGTLVGGPTFSTDVPVPPYITTTFSPTTAGTYQYYCTSHSSMIGNINVLQREGYENIFGIDRSTES